MRGAALGFLGVAAAGRDDLAAIEEGVGNRHRFLQQSAGIVAQVDDVALQLVGADLALVRLAISRFRPSVVCSLKVVMRI